MLRQIFVFSRSRSCVTSSSNRARCFSSVVNPINRVGVIGAGQMGTGIAIVSAVNAKLNTVIVDSNTPQLDKSKKFVQQLLSRSVSSGRLTLPDSEAAFSRITFLNDIKHLAQQQHTPDFVIEAVTENFDVKSTIFKSLAEATPSSCILASNTSSISLTKIAATVPNRANKVIGMHFMNPVPVMKLVEIIQALQTDDDTLNTTQQLAARMDKVTSRSRDVPGFIANRILMPYINEAVFALSEGVGSREDIDSTLKLGTGVPMGPLTLADFIGLDTCLAIMKVLHQGLGDDKYRPAPMLQQYVDAGYLGKKVGRGFYTYTSDSTLASANKK